jgi:hypothetical protein
MLSLAGISEKDLADAVREAFTVMKKNLSTTKVELVSFQGAHSEIQVPDNTTNQRAAEALLDVTGVSLSRQNSGSDGGDVHIEIVFPMACRPSPAIDVTPPLQAIEAMPPEKDSTHNV